MSIACTRLLTSVKRGLKSEHNGSIALEACVVVTMFLFLFLFLYSFFILFAAQNSIAHAISETSQSLALDAYAQEKLTQDDKNAIPDSIGSFLGEKIYQVTSDGPPFASDSKWYNAGGNVEAAVKQRFIAYYGNGSESAADERLKSMKVVGGLSGLDFSESKVVGEDIQVIVKYDLDYAFNAFGLIEINKEQRAVSHLWK